MSIAFALLAYLCLWPVPIQAVSWDAPRAPGFTGPHAVNQRLAGMRQIGLDGEAGPEHVAVGPDGKLYLSVASGRILRLAQDGGRPEVFAATGGRALGLAFDGSGKLIAADAFKGLLSVDANGAATVLVKAGPGQPLTFANAVAIAGNGKIFLTDSSARFAPAQWATTNAAAILEVLEQSATGRVLEYDPGTGRLRVVAQGFSLANGIALSADERSLFVSESGRYRVWKIGVDVDGADIAARPAGAQVLLENLPGFPDNLTRGADGRIWLGLAGQRNALDALSTRPFMREMALRIPRAMWAMPAPYGHVIAFTENGSIVDDLQDPTGSSPTTTGVTETAQGLYIHNVDGPGLGFIARPQAIGQAGPR